MDAGTSSIKPKSEPLIFLLQNWESNALIQRKAFWFLFLNCKEETNFRNLNERSSELAQPQKQSKSRNLQKIVAEIAKLVMISVSVVVLLFGAWLVIAGYIAYQEYCIANNDLPSTPACSFDFLQIGVVLILIGTACMVLTAFL